MDQISSNERHQRLDGDRGEAEHGSAQQNDAEIGRHGHIADTGRHGSPQGFRRQDPG